MRKIIWLCWFQGYDNAPPLVTRCIESWNVRNPGWDLRCLDATSIPEYIDLDCLVDLKQQTVTAASLSDMLRLLLLHEYGGVWVDATTYCNLPLDDWLPSAANTGFFAFDKPASDRPLASWFLASAPGNRLLSKWLTRIRSYWWGRTSSDDYFWVHHQFGDLCSSDCEAQAAWQSVPKISANGPHAIQFAGMFDPLENHRDRIDWTTPVFKLTHRVDWDGKSTGSLLDYVLSRHKELLQPVVNEFCDTGLSPMRVAGLKVSTENLGDHIQIIAAERMLKSFGVVPQTRIDRDHEIASLPQLADDQEQTGILLNGWFKTNPAEWPPHPSLSPIYLGFHIRLFQSPSLVEKDALEHYRKHGPVGCRDRYTLGLLQSRGIDVFLSHCLTLTLQRRIADPLTQIDTFVVSRDQQILDYLPKSIGSFEYITHYSDSSDFESNMHSAAALLDRYRGRAKLIITTMLHCALPAIAMGIPVVVMFPPNEGAQHQSDSERFSSLREIIRVFNPTEASLVDWKGYSVDVGHLKLAMRDRLRSTLRKWGDFTSNVVGPIAPSSVLPVPSLEKIDEAFIDVHRLTSLAQSKAADRSRWGHPSSYKANWSERSAIAACILPDGASILEIGVGAGHFREQVQNRCVYVGADLQPLDSITRMLNLDHDPLPQGGYDYIVSLGVFEYLHFPEVAAAKIAAGAANLVISYCCVRTEHQDYGNARKLRGWVNSFAEDGFTSLFEQHGYRIVSRIPFNVTEDFEQLIFHLVR